jgi:phage gpG-like protein
MISGYLIGDKALIAKMNAMPATVKGAIDATVMKLGFALQAKVQADYLRGPRPDRLGVKTGRLLGSITQGDADSRSRFESTPTTSLAYVGTNVSYGQFWEYGFSRRVGAGSRGGKFLHMGPKALESYFAKHPPGDKAYPARPFLAPALSDMRDLITQQLSESLLNAAKQALA